MISCKLLLVSSGYQLFEIRDRLRRADTSNHILALHAFSRRLTPEFLVARQRITRETDTGGGVVAHVSELTMAWTLAAVPISSGNLLHLAIVKRPSDLHHDLKTASRDIAS